MRGSVRVATMIWRVPRHVIQTVLQITMETLTVISTQAAAIMAVILVGMETYAQTNAVQHVGTTIAETALTSVLKDAPIFIMARDASFLAMNFA